MGRERVAIDKVSQAFSRLAGAVAQVNRTSGQYANELKTALSQGEVQAQAEYAKRIQASQRTLQQALAQAHQDARAAVDRSVRTKIDQAMRYLGPLAASWRDPVWEQSNRPGTTLPGVLRIGFMRWGNSAIGGEAPALLRLIGARSALFVGEGPASAAALGGVQSATLRLVAAFPTGAFRLTLIDAVGQGDNLKAFLRLPQETRQAKVFCASNEIDAELTRLASHVERVTQTRLLNFRSIEEYNGQVGEISVPYQFLVIANFPAGFSEAASARLVSIVQNGPRTGTYVLASVDPGRKPPHGFDFQQLQSHCTVIAGSDPSAFRWNDPDFGAYPVILDAPPATPKTNLIVDKVAALTSLSQPAGLPYSRIRPTPEELWQGQAIDGLSVEIGVNDTGAKHRFEIGTGTVHHGLLGGISGSGKTNLLHVLITQLVQRYLPGQLQLYLVDLKEGVGLLDYATFDLPHVRVVTGDTDREFAANILAALQREMEVRGELFRSVGCSEIADYYKHRGNASLPRILAIFDEYQVLFSEDDSLAAAASGDLADLVRRGRSFGIHVLLSSQSPASTFMSNRAAMNQLALRISLQCAEEDSRVILGQSNDAATRLLSRSGEAIYNDLNGDPKRNVWVQVAFLPPEERRACLQAAAEELKNQGIRRPAPLLLFDGKAPARLGANVELARVLHPDTAWLSASEGLAVWLGEPVDMKPHVAATLEQRSQANLLVAGQAEATGHALLASALISICAQRSPEDVEIHVLDFARANQAWSGLLKDVADSVGHAVRVASAREAAGVVSQLAEMLEAKRAQSADLPDVYLVVAGLDRFQALRETDKYDNPGETASQFLSLLVDGPSLGIHVLAWTELFEPVERILRRRGTAAFGLRVALPLSSSESNAFLGGPYAARLPTDRPRALFRDESFGGQVPERFKPYDLPTKDELTAIKLALEKKGAGGATAARARVSP